MVAYKTFYGYKDGDFAVTNVYANYLGYVISTAALPVEDDVAKSRIFDIPLSPDASVEHASFTVTAAAPEGVVPLPNVAEVRSSEPELSSAEAIVIDFGQLTDISDLSLPAVPRRFYRWNGTSWEDEGAGISELGTERLLVEFNSGDAPSVSEVLDSGTVRLPARPSGLELLVDGTVVWSERQGGPEPEGGVTTGVGFVVDRTFEVQEAARRLRSATSDPSADIGVRVEFRAAYPGKLTLHRDVRIRRSHIVAFPNGSSRSLERSEEGPFSVELPLPDASVEWLLDQVELTVRGSSSAERVQPASGPSFTSDANLSLTPARSVLLSLPDGLVDRFATLTGIRLALSGGSSAGEVGGRLLAAVDSAGPGEPVEGAELTPATVAASDAPTWTTLSFAAPVPSVSGPYWLELLVSYGDLTLQLTNSPPTDPDAPGARIHRRLAGGGTRPLTPIVELGPVHAAMRAVGVPDPNAPLDALELNIVLPNQDADTIDPTVAVGVTPIGEGVPVLLGLPGDITPAGNALELVGAAAASGSFTFDQITLTYHEPEEATP